MFCVGLDTPLPFCIDILYCKSSVFNKSHHSVPVYFWGKKSSTQVRKLGGAVQKSKMLLMNEKHYIRNDRR